MLPPSSLVISQGWGLTDLPLRASNEGLLRPRVARAQKIISLHPLLCSASRRTTRRLVPLFGYSDVMTSRSHSRAPRRRRRRRITLATVRRFARLRWREFRAFMRAVLASPPTVRAVVISVLVLGLWLGANWTYHAYYKPTEIFFPLAHSLDKRPAETWNEYGSLFHEHATSVITPELLAALAQVEGGGNPVARTYWRWQRTWNPLAVYQPASSAVG